MPPELRPVVGRYEYGEMALRHGAAEIGQQTRRPEELDVAFCLPAPERGAARNVQQIARGQSSFESSHAVGPFGRRAVDHRAVRCAA
jgi:hypothetical protein